MMSVEVLLSRLRAELAARPNPLFVGIDGRSGAGKSTLASEVARALARSVDDACSATVIEGDQFYGGGSAPTWDRQTAEDKVARVIDWRRQRMVLEQLRAHGSAQFHPFDWLADDWDADVVPLAPDLVVVVAGSLVLLEGAYSCRPELHDLLDLRVLLDTPHDVRRARLLSARARHTGRIGRRGGRKLRTITSVP